MNLRERPGITVGITIVQPWYNCALLVLTMMYVLLIMRFVFFLLFFWSNTQTTLLRPTNPYILCTSPHSRSTRSAGCAHTFTRFRSPSLRLILPGCRASPAAPRLRRHVELRGRGVAGDGRLVGVRKARAFGRDAATVPANRSCGPKPGGTTKKTWSS